MGYVLTVDERRIPAPAGGRSLCAAADLTYAAAMDRQPDDTALMLRYRDGDLAAFEMLYRRHNDSLYRYLLRLSLNPATTEDLFQEAWSKLIRARHRYRPAARFSTYLFRIAHNCFLDHLRRNRRYGHAAADADELAMDEAPGPDELTERQLLRRRLDRALADLPTEQRDAWLLHEEGGFSIEEIAGITGARRETAKSRVRYAVAKLKSALAETDEQADAAS